MKPRPASNTAALRRAANARLAARPPSPAASEADVRKLQQELEVHQVELELQNEELSQAKAALEVERENYFQFYNLSPAGFFTLDEAGLILEANLTGASLLSVDRSRLVKRPFTRFICSEDLGRYHFFRRAPATPGESTSCELRMLKKGGDTFWAQLAITSVPDTGGGRTYRLVLTDITKHKLAEAALQHSQRRYVLTEAAVNDGLWDWNILTDEDYFSPRWKIILGYLEDELLNTRAAFLALIHPEDQAVVLEATRAHLETRQPYAVEFRLRHKDGSYRWVFSRGEAVRDAAGRPVRMVGAITDITLRKQTEAALKESHARLQSIFRAAPAGIGLVRDRVLIEANEGISQMTGYALKELVGESSRKLYATDEEFIKVGLEKNRQMMTGGTGLVETRWQRKDGSLIDILLSSTPFDPADLSRGATFVALDITERKQVEAYGSLGREVLQILNEPGEVLASLERVVATLRLRTGFDAVGIRLQAGEDFPYFVQEGFPKDFLRTENTLIERTLEGGVCRDQDGKVSLECTCGLVLSGQTDPANPLFTQGGSCWTNDSPTLLQLPPGADPRRHPRNRCIHDGYRSVMLVPIRNHDCILGLIQFNDRRPGCFNLKMVELMEGIATQIGLALLRKQAEACLLKNQSLLAETEKIGHVGGWEFDIATRQQTWTEAVYAIHEVDASFQPTVASGVNFYTPASRPIIERAVQRAIELGETFDVELEIITAKGNLRSVHAIGHADLARGKVFGFFQDITASKQAQAALRESEQRYRELFELESDAIVLVDCETHRYVDCNLSAQRLYGYSREELLQMRPEDVSTEPEKTSAGIGSGSINIPLRWHRKKNGELFAAEITGNQIMVQGRRTFLTTIRDITARQQVMETLQKTTQQLLEAQRIARLGSYAFDVKSGTWTSSEVMDEVFGFAEHGLIRNLADWQQLIQPQDYAEMQRYLTEEVLTGRTPFDRTYRIIRVNDRQERWVHGLGQITFDEHGQAVQMVGTIQDITERQQAEAALFKERTLLQTLVKHLPVAVYLKDTTGRKLLTNPVDLQNMGLTAEADALGKTDDEMFPPEQAAIFNADDQRILQTRQAMLNHEEKLLWPDGSTRWLLTSKVPLFDEAGQVTGLAGIGLDITERKRTEAQMSLLFTALTTAANAIVITDFNGTVEWVNPAFTQLTGYTATEVVGANPRVLKSGQHAPSFYATLWATVSTGNVWHGEVINKRKNGELYHEDMTITPVRGADGKIAHFVAIKQDVTERRQLENRLQQAQKMEAIGTLAGGIAHDFNNILSAIFGNAYLLQQDTADNPEAQENVAEVLKAASRAKELVQQILTFSRQRELSREIVHLDTIIREATKFLRASLPALIEIDLVLAPDAPAVLANPTQIYQVTLNLATNALHAMEGRPGRLTVRLEAFTPGEPFRHAHPELKPGTYARLTIADTGHGMDAKTLARIFEPFFTTKPVGKGTGLGLAVVHGIVETHEGLITVESEVGHGTTFRLYFPAQANPTALTDTGTSKPNGGQGQTILLLDDEPALTTIYQRLLERLKYHVVVTNDAAEALRRFRENPAAFDLVITDLTMPEMSGLEVARVLHTLRPELPIILVSGYAPDLTPEHLHEAGILELLEKPVSPTALADGLQRALAGR